MLAIGKLPATLRECLLMYYYEDVTYRQLAEFTLESDRDLHFNLDGEPILTPRVTFSVLPGHLGVVS